MSATSAPFTEQSSSSAPALPLQSQQSPRRLSRRIATDLVGFVDAAAVVAGSLVPALIYQQFGELAINWPRLIQSSLVMAAIVYVCLRNLGHYDATRLHALPVEPLRLLGALTVAFLASIGIGMPFAPGNAHLWVWYAAWGATSFMLLLNLRTLSKAVLARMTAAGTFDTRVAVYGSGVVARRVHGFLSNPSLAIHFAGLFDDRHDASRTDLDGPALTGRLDDLVEAARAGRIDQIIIALPQSADERTQQIARRLEQLPVSLHVVTHIASDLIDEGPAHTVSSLGPVGLLDVKPKPLADWSRFVKEAEDRILGPILLVIALPLMALIALAIRIDSPGPAIFRQRRRGLNHQTIDMFKFRTMHVMEDGAEVKQATRDDPRVTRVGRILRRWSLDELPQLFNVVRGDMSLVGPRPHAVAHDDEYGELIHRYANRHQVKPGITGLAQINGFRGETTTTDAMRQRLEQDLEYVGRWSLWLDLKILALTLLRGWSGKSAY